MNILYLTVARRKSQKMTKDIIDELTYRGHKVFVVCPYDTEDIPVKHFTMIDGVHYLFVKSGYPTGKVGTFKKVKNFLTIDHSFKMALSGALRTVRIEMVLYSTPPITLVNTINWVKKKYDAVSYLMLKDIFPQNAVDLGMMKTKGILSIPYHWFRRKEKKLFRVSDYIGCMSHANVRYVLDHNPEVNAAKVGICVNSYRLQDVRDINVKEERERFGLPQDKTIFLYGGNLGKPQGLGFFVEVLRANKDKDDRCFVICGGGNDQKTITDFIEKEKPNNVKFISTLSPDEFDNLSRACDVGLIFLDKRFTIPNFPSRLLSIMLNEKPVLAATDVHTDIGDVIRDGRFGWWCESGELNRFNFYVDEICENGELIKMAGKNARLYYEKHYTQRNTYNQIMIGYNSVIKKKH